MLTCKRKIEQSNVCRAYMWVASWRWCNTGANSHKYPDDALKSAEL